MNEENFKHGITDEFRFSHWTMCQCFFFPDRQSTDPLTTAKTAGT